MHKPLRTLVSAAVFSAMATSAAHAGGFSLYTESSPLMTGNFGAGAAAEGADASIGWYNPAGLVLLHEQQLSVGGVGVFPTANLSGTSTFRIFGTDDYAETFSGLNGAENAFVPSLHYALPLGENATFGLSLVAPFGLSTNWGQESAVRYQGTLTELLTSNLSPELGAKLTENFSIGGGLDLQYAVVKFNRTLGLPNVYLETAGPMAVDSTSYNKGNSFGVGFHAGVLGMFMDNHARIGLNYQSRMRHNFYGYSELTGRLATPGFMPGDPDSFLASNPNAVFRADNLSSNPIELPEVVTLSGYYDATETVAVLASVVFTGWGTIETLQLNNVAAPVTIGGTVAQRLVNSVSPQNYKNTWRAALGLNYKLNEKALLRVGGGYDQSPTNDADRDVRLPDADRWALSIGGHYKITESFGVDAGYTHLFAADTPTINRTDALGATASYNVNAVGKAGADLVGAQLVWIIDPPAPTK